MFFGGGFFARAFMTIIWTAQSLWEATSMIMSGLLIQKLTQVICLIHQMDQLLLLHYSKDLMQTRAP